jgi:hypothetical protein
MPKRPLIITVIALCYLLSPAVIVLQTSVIHHIPLFGPRNIFHRLFFTDIVVLALYPACAACIFSVRKWGWYVFLSGSLLLIGYNTVVYTVNPRYTLVLLVLYNVVLAVVAGIFFRKHIIAPYFNPRLRWWETETRYRIDIRVEVTIDGEKLSGEILDISKTGCLLAFDRQLKLGTTHSFSLRCLGHFLEVQGTIMRKSSSEEEGDRYGIMFVRFSAFVREALGALIAELERNGFRDSNRERLAAREKAAETRSVTRIIDTAPRYTLEHAAILKGTSGGIHCRLLDMSKHGCRVKTSHEIRTGGFYRISLRCMKFEAEVNGRIEWKSKIEEQHGYGIMFVDLTRGERKNLALILRELGRAGLKDRLSGAQPVGEEILNGSVMHTPYRVVLLFNSIIHRIILRDVK